jgi:hypothetical protein
MPGPDLTDAEFEAARRRGEMVFATEPRAAKVRYDSELRRMIVDLMDGRSASFQPRLLPGLETATDDELAAVEMLGHPDPFVTAMRRIYGRLGRDHQLDY